jgi:hypothetical protein
MGPALLNVLGADAGVLGKRENLSCPLLLCFDSSLRVDEASASLSIDGPLCKALIIRTW